MRLLLASVFALLLTLGSNAAGPIRLLYLGKEGTPSAQRCAFFMQELGRDGIWFDYTSDPSSLTPDRVRGFDAALLDAPAPEFAGLAQMPAVKVLTVEASATPAALRQMVLAALGPARQAEWEQFLAGREPEQREPNPHVANYEKRAQPITFQHPFTPAGSQARTQVPADMHLELFASEPDIAKPIAFAWDERGRLWVAESRDYPHGVVPNGEGNDDIKICEDTKGTGQADKFTIFADHLNLPTSLAFANGGVLVSQPPRLLFLKSSKGDDHADIRETVMEGWGVRDTHAQANNLHYGFDNWIYGCVGYSGFEGTVGGRSLAFSMGTYRFKPDGSALEFLHQFSNNSWAHSVNAAGDQFGGTANNAPIFYGGIPATVVPEGVRVMTAKKINVEDKAHAITPNYRQVDVFGGYTAAAGSNFIYSAQLPPRLQGRAMVCEPTMKIISLMNVQPDGAGYVAKDDFNLVASSDEWMSPVFAEVGPDGAVWFADWENFIIQHNPTPSIERGGYVAQTGPGGAHENALRDHERGRIYRVVWDRAPKPAIASLQGTDGSALIRALSSDNPFWQLTAQRLLVQGRHLETAEALKKLAGASDGSTAAVHALWSLQGLGLLDEATARAALGAKDPALRRNAIRALGSDAASEKLLLGASVISDPEPHTRLAAFVKLAAFPTSDDLKTLVVRLAGDPQIQTDEWLRDAVKVLVKKQGAQLYKEGPNLLPTPGFETAGADGLPQDWTLAKAGPEKTKWELLSGEGNAHSGEHGLRCITYSDGESTLSVEVPLAANTQYRLSGWIKTHALKGRASLRANGEETDQVTAKDSGWTEVEKVFQNSAATKATITLRHQGKGDSYFDDVKLCAVTTANDDHLLAGDPGRGEQVFLHHPTSACILCHSLHGQGSTVGPPLDGIAIRATPAYILESLLEPNKVLAKGYESLGVSPMPPMGIMLKPQELEDIKAFLQTLQ